MILHVFNVQFFAILGQYQKQLVGSEERGVQGSHRD